MKEFSIHETAYVKMILHATKYSMDTVFGVLVGKSGLVSDYVPVGHNPLIITPMTSIALEQIKLSNRELVGLFVAGDFHPAIQQLGEMTGASVILRFMPSWLKLKQDLALSPYIRDGNGWKTIPKQYLKFDQEIREKASELVKQQKYRDLYDFDNYLANCQLDWITNNALSLEAN